MAGVLGFLAGQLLATLLDLVAANLAHYPGGIAHLARTLSPPWWANAFGLVGLWVGFGSAIYYAHFHGNLPALPHQWRPRVSDLGYVALGVACQLLIDAAYRPFHFKELNRPVKHLFGAASGPSFVLLAIMTLLIAPVMEEWLFRGVLLRAISEGGTTRSVVRIATGVAGSAVLFALAHGEPLQFAGLVVLGVVLALLVVRTKRLVPSIVTHVSFNGVAIVALIAQRASH